MHECNCHEHHHDEEHGNIMDLVLDIKTLIKQHSNAETMHLMLIEGIIYKVNYGVAIDDLRKIAHGYMGNHELALALFRDDFRECKLIATMIDNPHDVTNDQIDEWANDFTNTEIVDQVCLNLLCRSKHALARSFEWCLSMHELTQRAGLTLIAKNATNPKVTYRMLEPYIDTIEDIAQSATGITSNAIAFALYELAQHSPEMSNLVVACASNLSAYDNEYAAKIGGELLIQLGY